MSVKKGNFSRREFIKTAGGVGLGSALISLSSLTHAHGSSSTRLPENMIVPMRTFGKTGVTILQANVAAALNKNNLSEADKQRLEQYADQTAPCYCAGCAKICESSIDIDVPISDVLRYCMYNHSYGDRNRALTLFNALPEDIKLNILKADYSKAEKHCPQKIQIGKVLKKTYEDLT
jgi:predicted aldo/keto reductase-like oxidoreductase